MGTDFDDEGGAMNDRRDDDLDGENNPDGNAPSADDKDAASGDDFASQFTPAADDADEVSSSKPFTAPLYKPEEPAAPAKPVDKKAEQSELIAATRGAVQVEAQPKKEKKRKEKKPKEKKSKLNAKDKRAEKKERRREKKKNRSFALKTFLFLFSTVMFVGIVGGLGVGGYSALYVYRLSLDMPDYSVLQSYEPDIMTRIHAGDGTLIAEYANERRLFVPIEAVPEYVRGAFISAEDKNFYTHNGVDFRGIARAAVANVNHVLNDTRLEGASTITQQVAKNFLLTSETTIQRKVREALLAMRIEEILTKDDILELYLNQIYLGWRSYGIAAAALNYFNKPLDELTIAEAAYLAVMPKGPENYRPDRERSRASSLARRNYVLNEMVDNGYITEEQAVEARNEELVVFERPAGAQVQEADYFAEEVRRRIASEFGFDALLDGGLSVRTSVDMEYQTIARNALRNGLIAYDQRHGWRGAMAVLEGLEEWPVSLAATQLPRDLAPWRSAVVLEVSDALGTVTIGLSGSTMEEPLVGTIPLSDLEWARIQQDDRISVGPSIEDPSDVLSPGDVIFVEEVEAEIEAVTEIIEGEEVVVSEATTALHWSLRQIPAVNGGIVVMDPHTGRVLAMVGGFSFDASEFNRATQARRQPGSSFKPFVYAAALDAGRTPSDLILDAPFVMPQGEGLPLWRPDNYSDRFYGPSTLRSGVERSRNAMTVRLAQDVGMERVVDIATRFGVVDHMDPYLAYALGAGETTLMRMTAAYSQFVNGGRRVRPIFIDRVQDRYGLTISRSDERVCEECSAEVWEGQAEPQLPDAREEVLDPATAYQVVSILEGVVQRGTGRSLRSVGVPLGGKTGTTNDERDAWFMGISPDLVAGAYVGFDAPYPMGRRETGGRVAAPIVREFLTQTVGTRPPIPFRRPPGIRIVRVNVETGLLAGPGDLNVIEEAFRPGTEPTGESAVIGSEEEDDFRSGSGGLY